MGGAVSLGAIRQRHHPGRQKEATPVVATTSAQNADSPQSQEDDSHGVVIVNNPHYQPAPSRTLDLVRRLSNASSPPRDSPLGSSPSRSAASRDLEQQAIADMFSHTALALGMDNDDLLFNMMFFDDGSGGTFGHIMNTVQQETLALHSEHNTPYKLNPASETAVNGLVKSTFTAQVTDDEFSNQCAVCKESMEDGCATLKIPTCLHFFHEDCLLKWSSLQCWCPVCRAPLAPTKSVASLPPEMSYTAALRPHCEEHEREREGEEEEEEEHEIHPQAAASIRALTTQVGAL